LCPGLDTLEFSLPHIRRQLKKNTLTPVPVQGRRAAVAMIFSGTDRVEELLFIRRAEYENDPWSGDIAFPGGGIEAQDSDCRAAAERETREEIGLTLTQQDYLGFLGTIGGAHLPVNVSAHVYHRAQLPCLTPNFEVVETLNLPLDVLRDPKRNRLQSFNYRGATRQHPIVDLHGYAPRFLWGISYRLLQIFFAAIRNDTL
jgi:8-oxo-dGTP pyrophosphatase MutT (NUDIX family)